MDPTQLWFGESKWPNKRNWQHYPQPKNQLLHSKKQQESSAAKDEEEDEARTSLMESLPTHHILLPPFLHNSQTQNSQTQILNNHRDAQFSRWKPADGPREKEDEEREKRQQTRLQLEGRGWDEAYQEAEETLHLLDGRAEFG